MKIAMFSDTYFPQINGVTYTISLWKDRLEKRGNEVIVFFPSSTYDSKRNEVEVKSIPLPFYDGYRIGLPASLKKELSDVDIIHTHTPFSLGILGGYYSKKLSIPRVCSYHTPPEHYIDYLPGSSVFENILIKLYRFWEKKFLNSCKAVFTPSEFISEELEQKKINDVFVLKNGVNNELFRPCEKIFKEKYDSKYLIGYSGRHSKEKNLKDLINLSKELNNTQVLIAGNGPYHQRLQKKGEDLDNIDFLGFLKREKLPNFYSSLDAFIFPSIAETQGLVALEANACGTPVVGANKKALKETIKNGINGYRYQPNNIQDLKQKTKKVLKQKGKMEKRALKYSKYHFIDETIDKLINQYKRICIKNETKKLYD